MNPEQINLYDNLEKFRQFGKSPEELEKDAKVKILQRKISEFIEKKKDEIGDIQLKKREIGILDVDGLIKKFSTMDVGDEEKNMIRTLFAKTLLAKGYTLSGFLMTTEIKGKDVAALARKPKINPEKQVSDLASASKETEKKSEPVSIREEKERDRRERDKLSPQERGIPNSDL